MGSGLVFPSHKWLLEFSGNQGHILGASQSNLFTGIKLLLLSGGHKLLPTWRPAATYGRDSAGP